MREELEVSPHLSSALLLILLPLLCGLFPVSILSALLNLIKPGWNPDRTVRDPEYSSGIQLFHPERHSSTGNADDRRLHPLLLCQHGCRRAPVRPHQHCCFCLPQAYPALLCQHCCSNSGHRHSRRHQGRGQGGLDSGHL